MAKVGSQTPESARIVKQQLAGRAQVRVFASIDQAVDRELDSPELGKNAEVKEWAAENPEVREKKPEYIQALIVR